MEMETFPHRAVRLTIDGVKISSAAEPLQLDAVSRTQAVTPSGDYPHLTATRRTM